MLAIYQGETGELRSNFKAFAQRDDSVDSIIWKKRVGNRVAPGDVLAEVQWAGLSMELLLAPEDCIGKIQDINRDIIYEELGDPPAQYLAQIG